MSDYTAANDYTETPDEWLLSQFDNGQARRKAAYTNIQPIFTMKEDMFKAHELSIRTDAAVYPCSPYSRLIQPWDKYSPDFLALMKSED